MTSKSPLITGLLFASLIFWITAALLFAVILPIQTDEISWALVNHRAVIDHYATMTLYPQCGRSVFPFALPLVAHVPAWINHLIFSPFDSPALYRLLGTGKLLVWLGLLWLIVRPLAGERKLALLLFTTILSALSLDATILTLVVSRPEQSLVLGAICIVFLVVNAPALRSNISLRAAATVLLILVVLQTSYAHAKAGALIPFFCLAGYLFAARCSISRIFRIVLPLIVAGVSVPLYLFWSARLKCPDSAEVQVMISNYTLPLGQFFVDPARVLNEAITNFSLAIIGDLQVSPLELADWWIRLNKTGILVDLTSLTAAIAFFVRATLLIFCVRCLIRAVCKRKLFGSGTGDSQYVWLSAGLLMFMLSLFVFLGRTRSFYLSSLEVPLLLLITAMLLGPKLNARRSVRLLAGGIVALGNLNLCLLLAIYYSPADKELVQKGRTISFFDKRVSDTSNELQALARECEVDPLHSQHLVVDDITYPHFRQSSLPFHIHYVSDRYYRFEGQQSKADIDRFMRLLVDWNSPGVIVDCRNIPELLEKVPRSRNGFCCLSATQILAYTRSIDSGAAPAS